MIDPKTDATFSLILCHLFTVGFAIGLWGKYLDLFFVSLLGLILSAIIFVEASNA